ncbi:hypothetical protein COT77_03335 [Candidatus Berkelbacteria bacterium CG10_big_fil_rev_8_21_14_0_10_41_12]|uniref:Uncharacterized protein n=1 Tax=Candidatus Berkelbacteria bacterium CG10_big_fil_rev_8_21_14_0_10_41_12 TaxID=1974513 RepID=A0A2M6WWC7_9BACT|nr:MAG: hypothetical protein COT77_03335 [Candidatus Berkelbacteria bacterium CG10_big_fil_rev_8_21_14_0_10_41_12]
MMDMKVVLYSDPTPIFVLVAGFHFEKGQHVEAGRVIVEMLEECDCGMLPKPGFSTKPVRGLLLSYWPGKHGAIKLERDPHDALHRWRGDALGRLLGQIEEAAKRRGWQVERE